MEVSPGLSIPGDDWFQTFQSTTDPFGMLRATSRVQQTWLLQPVGLAEQYVKLYDAAAAAGFQIARQAMGQSDHEVAPAVEYDERFADPVWNDNLFFNAAKQFYLLASRWSVSAAYDTPGATDSDRRKAAFLTRQVLNAVAPSNFFWTNPAAVLRALETGGRSLVDGTANLIKDVGRGTIPMTDERRFVVGENLATTPGRVVMRNELLELIQYAPLTARVRAIPIVIVAPWINKYYIMDLDAHKSLVRFLTSQGFTVFMTSWKNPSAGLRATTLDDYMIRGVHESVLAACDICHTPKTHLVGYCIGGTLVSALMAWYNAGEERDMPVAHWTLLASLADFSDPGDIRVFIDDKSIGYLEQRMARLGYLDGRDMAAAFRSLRPNSLVWRYFIDNYLLGVDLPESDVLFWNMDTTRMPAAMHSTYLRECYLHNRLCVPGALTLANRTIDLGKIKQPLYSVGAEQDHIAPWQQTFRICALTRAPVRYALATSVSN